MAAWENDVINPRCRQHRPLQSTEGRFGEEAERILRRASRRGLCAPSVADFSL